MTIVTIQLTNLPFQHSFWSNNVVKNVFTNMRVYCRQRIIKEIDVSFLIDSSGKTDTLFLTSTKIDTLNKRMTNVQIDKLLTFSPISVISPPDKISRSGSRAQESIVWLYKISLYNFPNKMLSLMVAF